MSDRKLGYRGLLTGAVVAAVCGAVSSPASADMNLYEANGLKVDAAITAGVAGFASPGAQFGAGSWAPNQTGGAQSRISGRPAWTESFVTPELKISYETDSYGTFYGDVSAQGTYTGGDGDPSLVSTTYGRPFLVELENLYVGWKSGKLIDGLDENGLDISGGRQSFRVADGFLISNGVSNQGKRGMYWTQSRTAFSQTGIVKLAKDNVRADVFYLQNESVNSKMPLGMFDSAKTKIVGGNVELFETLPSEEGKTAKDGAANFADRKWYVGATAFRVVDATSAHTFSFNQGGGPGNAGVTNTLTSNRHGMNVFSVHVGGNIVPQVPDFSLYGNAVYERNNSANRNVDANAFYIEPGYQFSDWYLTPKISYRYAHFSGDGNSGDTKKNAYDPFFYNAITRGYGTWFIGEIVGNYVISNSNVNIHQVAMSINPLDNVKLSVLAYTYAYDKRAQNNLTSDKLAKEIDFTAEWAISDNMLFSAAFGMAKAGAGYREFLTANANAYPANETWLLGEAALVLKF